MINVADCSTCSKSKILRISFGAKMFMPLAIVCLTFVVDPIMSEGRYDGLHVVISGLLLQLLCELTLASGPGTFFVLFMTNLASPVLDVVRRNDGRRRDTNNEKKERVEEEENDDNIPSVLSLMWAFHALIAKPLNSVGPIVGAYFLIEADIDPYEEWNRAFMLLFLIPMVTGIVQMCFFQMHESSSLSNASQHGHHLELVKISAGVEEEEKLLGGD